MKLFRFHRGGLAESLATAREVKDLQDLKCEVRAVLPFATNIRISQTRIADSRLPDEWDGVSHYVLADLDGYKGQCIGMCNFFAE